MARTLPWLSAPSRSTSSRPPASSRPTKRQRTRSLSPSSATDTLKLPQPRHTKLKMSAPLRSSSHSPPPSPPPPELMRPGLDADDVFVMVEDEFHATAQSYTQHLHHAEYKRLTALAKNKRAEEIARISRPVVGTTGMSEELRKKKARAKNAQKQERALVEIGAKQDKGKGKRKATDEEDEDDSDLDVVRDDDPWVGTTLQALMTSQEDTRGTSLVGLQGVTIRSRAAAGLGRSQSSREKAKVIHGGVSSNRVQKETPQQRQNNHTAGTDAEETATDSDDLERSLAPRKPAPSSMRGNGSELRTAKVPGSRKVAIREPEPDTEVPRSHKIQNDRPKSILKSTARTNLDSLDDYMRPTPLLGSRGRAARNRQSQEERTKKSPEGSVDEIPVFLV